ncbi:hypothetical protein JCM3774_002308 [Rhodotorula dairenensis]
MPRHSRRHRYDDSDETPPSSSAGEDETTDESDVEKAPIKHHHRHRHHHHHGGKHHGDVAATDNRVWIALAGLILLMALMVGGYYLYSNQSAAGPETDDSGGGLFDSTQGGLDPLPNESVAETPVETGQSDAQTSVATGKPDAASTSASVSVGVTGTATGQKSFGALNPATGTLQKPKETQVAGGGGAHKILGFWENWKGASVADTDFSSYTHAVWFVAVPGTVAEKGKLDLGEAKEGLAKEWVQAAKKANCKSLLSIGGWSGSKTFSSLVATDQSRKAFVETIATTLNEYEFDGCDLDWEYPGRAGDSQDFDVKNDLKNWLTFIWALRAKLGKDKVISADTSATPWVGADGNPSKDLSMFAVALDFITIMTYDSVTYSSKTTGPNFAYEDTCAPAAQRFSIPKTVKMWTDAKFPANKIMLGLATYGYAWKVSAFKEGGGADGASSSIYQTVATTLTDTEGSLPYDQIKPQISSMKRTFDKCSSTPFLYSSSTQLFISYDDDESIKIKGAYAGKNGLMGCSLYAGMTQNKDSSLAKVAKTVC